MGNDSDVKVAGIDAQEIQEWIESFDAILKEEGRDAATLLLDRLRARATDLGVGHAFTANTPYLNTIPADKQAIFPGDQEIERRIKSLIRWNALAMVVRANRVDHSIGGHISTYASAATLVRSRIQSFLPRAHRAVRGRHRLSAGTCFSRRLFPRLSGRPPVHEAAGKFPPRTPSGRRAVVPTRTRG